MGLKFHWAIHFFLPPIFLAKFGGLCVVPLATALAGAWLWSGRRTLDIVLLAFAFACAAGVAWMVEVNSSGPRSARRFASIGCGHFIWFAALLLPVRWISAYLLEV